MPPYRNYIYEYHAKITSGEIIAGKWIKKIYEIIINGLQKQEYFFNAKAANKAIRFIENFCHHSKGRNDLIKLELWQKAIVSVIFGIQDAEKIRIFREIFIVIGRKNGKSLFASAIIAYMAYLEPEYGQEIYCLAPKLDQAALVYDGFYQMVQAEDELAELAKKRRSDIYIAESNTVIKPIAMVASGELAAADLLAKIESAENQRYIECGVAAVEEEKKAVTVYYCDEAAVGMKFVAGDVSGTVQGVTHIQTDEAAAAGEAGNDRTALTLSKAVKAGCKVIALERTDTVAGMTTDDIAALKGVLKQYE